MLRNGAGDTERKAKTGTQPIFAVRLRQPPSGDAITVTFDPDGVILSGGAEVMSLTSVRPSDDTVNGIDAHRKTLTASGGVAALRRLGTASDDFGAAFLITNDASWFPIQVANIRGTSIILSKPLPRDVEIDADETADVRYAVHVGTLPAAVSVAATGGTPIPWVVTYTADLGSEIDPHPAQEIRGVLHIRDRIFDTGLDHHTFEDLVHGIIGADAVYGSQGSWTPQIDAAHLALVLWIRGNIDSLGDDREDSIDGGSFRLAHAYWTAAFAERDPDARAGLIAEAKQLAKDAAESLVETSPTTDIPEVRDHGRRASIYAGASTPRTSSSADVDFFVGRPL